MAATGWGADAAVPFDQHQRYATVRDLVTGAREALGAGRWRVLDVGGFFRENSGRVRFPIATALPAETTVVVDTAAHRAADGGGASYLTASGLALPFADEAFDVVVSCDTLEHVPRPDRPRFVGELARVARRYLVLAAPQAEPAVELAERVLAEFAAVRLGAAPPQLAEHAASGLPSAAEVGEALAGAGLHYVTFPGEDLYGWLFMMLAKHYLLAVPSAAALEELADRLYVASFPQGPLPESRSGRAYRRFFVAARRADDPYLVQLQARLAALGEGPAPAAGPTAAGLELLLAQLVVAAGVGELGAARDEAPDVVVGGGRAEGEEASAGQSAGQSFVSRRAGLSRIDLPLGVVGGTAGARLCLRLREAGPDGPEVAAVRLDAPADAALAWLAFRFPPQARSQGQPYHFEVALEGGAGALALLWEPGVAAPGQTRYRGRQPAAGRLVFRSHVVPPAIRQPLYQWTADLQRGKDWWEEQAGNWRRIADELGGRLAELERSRVALEEQASNWRRLAEEQQALLADRARPDPAPPASAPASALPPTDLPSRLGRWRARLRSAGRRSDR